MSRPPKAPSKWCRYCGTEMNAKLVQLGYDSHPCCCPDGKRWEPIRITEPEPEKML